MSIKVSDRYLQSIKKEPEIVPINHNSSKFFEKNIKKIKKKLDTYSKKDVYSNMNKENKQKSKLIKVRSNQEFRMKSNPPQSYEAYLYQIDLYDKKEHLGFYIGYHTGEFKIVEGGGATYFHSSSSKKEKCVRFRKLCRDSSIHMIYTILQWGTTTRMTVEEAELLRDADPKNNDKCFNDSVGAPKYTKTDNDKIFALADKILNNIDKYEVKNYKASDLLEKFDKVQARAEENEKLYLLQEKVDSVMGRLNELKLWTPILLVEVERGVWKLIDGNTRVLAVDYSKHGKELPALHIPYEVIEGWTDSELHSLANAMNPKREDLSEEMSDEDAIKEIVGFCINDNYDVDDPSNTDRLERYGFSPKQIASILNRSKVRVRSKKAAGANCTWINWKQKGWNTELNKLVEWLQEQNYRVLDKMSSGKYNMHKIIDAEYKYQGEKIYQLIHHPSDDAFKSHIKEVKDFNKKYKRLFEKFGSEVIHLQLPTSRDEELKSPSHFWDSSEGQLWLQKNNMDVKK